MLLSAVYIQVDAQENKGSKPGRLTGIILDINNLPISGVSIAVEKERRGTSTSVAGDYVLVLAPGTYTVLVSAVNYSSQRVSGVVIRSDEQTDLSLTLSAGRRDTLVGVTVTAGARRASAAGLLLAQKNAPSMSDGISAEQMAKVPDNNIAKVLKRVSGLTVQGEKFVTIRGISDRYVNVMINGSILPSTEPNRRNFSFDIIPAALVDNVVVNKTATPDLSAEFTGGIVQVFTKDVPVKNFLQLAIGTGINTASTGKEFVSFERDRNANIGQINSNRLWFGDGRLLDPVNYGEADIKKDTTTTRLIRSRVPNAWQLYRYGYTPVQNYQLSGGITKRFSNNNSFGAIAAFTYMNEQLSEEGHLGNSGSGEYTSVRNRYTSSIGALLNTAYKTKRHKISWKNLYNLRYNDQYDEKYGYNYNASTTFYIRTNVTLQNKLFQTRLEGEHLLTKKDIKVEWSADNIELKREQPHTRGLLTLDLSPDTYGYDFARAFPGLFGLYSCVLDENRRNFSTNISFPFVVKNVRQLLKIGYSYTKRSSDLNAALFHVTSDSVHKLPVGSPYYEIVTPENFRNGFLTFSQYDNSVVSTGDAYNGTQSLHALFAMVDLRFFKKFRLTGGLRNESNTSILSTLFYTYPAINVLRVVDSTKEYYENHLLPSANLIYSLTNKMNFRAAFSKTIARPELVERSPYLYNDVAEQLTVTGQRELKISTVRNYDFRFEYYPSSGEIVSASIFYKNFDKPVERLYSIEGVQPGIRYQNMQSAIAKGFEIDFRKSLEFLGPSSAVFQHLVVSGNFTYIEGKVVDLVFKTLINPYRDTSFVVNADRPLQGLSPFIINAGISYDRTKWGLNIAFNRSGRRNITGGSLLETTQYENPRSILDFQANVRLLKQKLELKLNVSDIFNQPFIIYSNAKKQSITFQTIEPNDDPKGAAFNEELDYVNYKVKKGTSISFNLTYRF
ncbi:MAG: TonB-dependent receptor [Chitinophagaceae bacterium]|nr:TonB-dependent receptor [Chitinophagaceae bacterium]